MDTFAVLSAFLFTSKVKVLEHDTVHIVCDCGIHDGFCRVNGQLLVGRCDGTVDVFAFLSRLLVHALAVDPAVQTVFITAEVDDTPGMDSTVCRKDGSRSRCIDPEVYHKDAVF